MSKSLEECLKTHPRAKSLDVAGVTIVFRKPKSIEWNAFLGAAASRNGSKLDGPGVIEALEELTKSCVLSHTPAEMDAIVEPLNGDDGYLNLYTEVGGEIVSATNAGMESFGKKPAPASTAP